MNTHLKTIVIFITWITSSNSYDDLSGNKAATQSTTMPCVGCSYGSFIANMAVDNNKTTCTRTVFDSNQWWMVDLMEIKSIYAIKFSFREYEEYGDIYRSRQQERLSGYSFYVSNSPKIKSGELCFKHNGSYPPSLTTEHVCISYGRYVQFLNEKKTYIELCSLIVLGCDRGYYGVGCNYSCPQHCKNDRCFVTNGTCVGCANGWTGSKCSKACSAGNFGPDCLLSCSGHCKNNSTCNPTNGMCLDGCSDGWKGVLCNKSCATGTFGPDCKHNCSKFCLNDSVCNRIAGKCDEGCKPGYIGEQCNKVCTVDKYGTDCMFSCSQNCIHKEPCDHVTGVCENGCSDGYKGELCNSICGNGYFGANCFNVCSENCSDICHHIDGKCNCKAGMRDSPECIQEEGKSK